MARRGVLQKDIAAVLGISVASVSAKLRGETPIKVGELIAIAKRLDLPPSALIDDTEPPALAAGSTVHKASA